MREAVAKATEALLKQQLSCPENAEYQKLYSAMQYSVFAGGKRIRPYLCAEFYLLYSGKEDFTPVIPYCAAVEMIHTSSLIHDDLPAMDNDVLRRGKPTNHVKFGEATAILAGDTLLLKGCGAAASNPYLPEKTNALATALVSRKSCGMMAGQQIDLTSSEFSASEQLLVRMQSLKTGCLLSLSCMLGALAADTDTAAAEQFGNTYGLLFQLTDDLLDLSSHKDTGKSRGKDERDHKATFVTLFGAEQAEKKADALLKACLSILSSLPDSPSKARLQALCKETRYRIN